MNGQPPIALDAEFVPADATATRRRVDRVDGDNRLAVANSPVDESRHDLVALRIEAAIGPWLRDAVGQLSVTEIPIRRDGDAFRPRQRGLRGVLPVHVKAPRHHRVVFEDLLQLGAARRNHDVGSAGWREALAVDVGVVQEVHTVDDQALFGRRFALEHRRAIDDARMFLNDFVARARRIVVAVRPDRRTRVIGE